MAKFPMNMGCKVKRQIYHSAELNYLCTDERAKKLAGRPGPYIDKSPSDPVQMI